jgi:glycosyltransferase involved in cell wall biosynthesis
MLNYEFPPLGGGTGMACRQLLQAFGRNPEVEVDLVTSGLGSVAVEERLAPNVRAYRLPVGKRDLQFWRAAELARWSLTAGRHARSLARGEPFDLCHCWAGWPSGVLGYRLRRHQPYIVALRGSDVPGYSRRLAALDPLIFRTVSRRVWSQAAAVVAVSDGLRTLALRTSPDLDVQIIPNAADTRLFSPAPAPDCFTVLFVGRLVPRKRATDALEGFRRLLAEIPSARLVIVGDGPDAAPLRARSESEGLGRSVVFRGNVAHEDLPNVYRDASVCLVPSEREGMPNVLLEAMASGLPVVTTLAESTLVRGNGVVVPLGDTEAIGGALLAYARDPVLREAHGRRSRQIAEATSWDSVAGWYLELYRATARRTAVNAVGDKGMSAGA